MYIPQMIDKDIRIFKVNFTLHNNINNNSISSNRLKIIKVLALGLVYKQKYVNNWIKQ